ncbi:MAG TPA: chromosome segregation protein SMC [Bacteroidota bacterium]
MYLSKLEVIGFKSFANKINVTFDSGISAIVGPNGCGKSNIVDAIRWVLGEQRYSTLRSEKMEDVIFNGTKNRKPLGMAEASLVIENTKGILPSEYAHVTVGRRVYRSGESEYLLNKVPCRLKDILDLFMDTGMGSDAYSVIELKMVETILSDKTDERRRLFEEASGVTKYKHRRKAAYRKLESVQADLLRVNDIVAEVHKAVNTLERQAKKAEQYNELKNGLQVLEIDLLEREFAQLRDRLIPLEEKLSGLTRDRSRIDVDLTNEEQRLDALRETMLEVEHRLGESQKDINTAMDRFHQVEQKTVVAQERSNSLTQNVARFGEELMELERELVHTEEGKGSLRTRIEALTGGEEAAREDLAREKEQLEKLDTTLDEKKARLKGLNERTMELVHEIAAQQTAQERTQGQIDHLKGRIERAGEEVVAYEQEILRIEADIESLSAEDGQLRRKYSEAEVRYYSAESKKNELKEEIHKLQRKRGDLNAGITQQRARVDFLRGLIESQEGMSEGARYLSSASEWSENHLVTVADAIHADERYRAAIESALGDNAGLVIVNSVRDAEQGISLLTREEKGKATFVCLDRIPKMRRRFNSVRLPGVVGWASSVAQCEPSHADLFQFLLGNTLLVEDRTVAAKVTEMYSGVRCVTVNGEVATSVGIVRGGSRRLDEGGLIGKQKQLKDLEKVIQELSANDAVIASEIAEQQAAHDAIHLKPISDEVKSVEKEMSAVEIRIAQLEFEKKRAGDIIEKNRKESEDLTSKINEMDIQVASAGPALEQLRAEKETAEKTVSGVIAELASLEHERANQAEVVGDLGIRSVTLHGNRANAESELLRADEKTTSITATQIKRNEDTRRATEDQASITLFLEEQAVVLSSLREDLGRLEEKKRQVEEEASGTRSEMHGIELRIKDERRSHDDSMKAVHELELKIQGIKSQSENLKLRAREEFELELQLKQYPEDEFIDFAALRDEIQGFKNKLKSLGNVNFAAFEEYTSEKQRYEFLTTQRNDLLEAEKTLLSTIEEINATAQRQFLETFEKIRTNFIDIFKSLFDPGDECDLKLEEGIDPLEAAIDIIAKPRGKRPTSIHLLSGGEKTLTATALLFAIYLVKPSPFCILDEVDAPLDDANIDRFTRILKKFSDNTQFIVVTHNKRTMEAAQALYGVTMEEEGVSKLVTVRFNKEAEVESAAVLSN